MSNEAYALCPRPLAGVSDWQAGLDALGFDLQLRGTTIPPASSGHLPAVRRGRASGFECSIVPFSELKETYPETDFAGSWPCVYAFWFGTIAQSIGALMAITACVTSVGGSPSFPRTVAC